MWEDSIVKETRAAREELFASFHKDLAALCSYLREKEREHPDRVVTLPPRRPEIVDIGRRNRRLTCDARGRRSTSSIGYPEARCVTL